MSRASRALVRCVVSVVRSPSVTQSSRSFSLSAQHHSEKTPSLADISGDHVAEFDAKQKEFRSQLAAAKAKADSQSSSSSSSASSLAASASQYFASKSSDKKVMGSPPLDTEEAREAARAKAENGSNGQKQGALSNLIYGTEAGRQMDQEIERSFSEVLARGKYVHSIVFHEVKPDKVDEYVELVGGWYPKVAANPENKVNLVGSWRTEVGDCDTFGKALAPYIPQSINVEHLLTISLRWQSTSGSTNDTTAITTRCTQFNVDANSPTSITL